MKKALALLFAALVALPALVDAHAGNVRRSDCTHQVSGTNERHRHTGRPYCPTGYEQYMTTTWMHH